MNSAQQAAFRLWTTMPVRTVSAKARPAPEKPLAIPPLGHRAAEIRKLKAKGYGTLRIARALGCARTTVWRHLKGRR